MLRRANEEGSKLGLGFETRALTDLKPSKSGQADSTEKPGSRRCKHRTPVGEQ
jgi:hypothetical protein